MAARPPTDVFRPCLPLDPFAAIDLGPWRPSIPPHADPPSAVLVLGEPALSDLYPILFSSSFAQSLVVLATHAPPYIPQKPSPSVRILRLNSPLAQDSGALRLVSLLERADRVVRQFRTCDTEWPKKLVQLAENTTTGDFDVEEPYSPSTPPSSLHDLPIQDFIKRYPSPAPSAVSSTSSSSTFSASSSSYSIRSSSSTYLSRRRRAAQARSSQPAVDRAFDAIINFLPNTVPDKLLLKYAILVSTLTTSFFAAPPAPLTLPLSYLPSKPKRRLSIFSNRSSSRVADPAKEHQQPPASAAAAKKNPRRFSTILRRQQNPTSKNEIVHSAPCSRDSLPLTSGVSHVKGKIRSYHQRLTTPESQRKPHLIHILPSHVYNTSTASSSTMGASGSNGRSRKHQLGHQRQYPKIKPKLVQSVEQFLLAYGYPLQSMSAFSSPASPSSPASRRMSVTSTVSNHTSVSFSGDITAQQKAIPFLLPAGVFGSVPSGGKMTIGEILLMGGLDGQEEKGEEIAGMEGLSVEEGRVWIASADDVVWDEPASPSICHPANRMYVESPELRGPAPTGSFSSSPLNTSRSAPSSLSLSTSPVKPRITPSQQYFSPPASRNSTLNPKPTVTYAPAPSAPALSAAVPSRPRKTIRRASSSPIDEHIMEKGQHREREGQQLPTPPESSSSLEDEADTTPYGVSRSVSSSGSNSACVSDMTHARTPSWSRTNSDVGHHTSDNAGVGVGMGKHPSKRGHYTTTSAAAAARTQTEEKAVKQKRRSSWGRALEGLGKLVSGGGGAKKP